MIHKWDYSQCATPVSAALLQKADAALQLHHPEVVAAEVPAQLCLLDDRIRHCKSPCNPDVTRCCLPCLA